MTTGMRAVIPAMIALLAASLGGCGGGTSGPTAVSKIEQSGTCIGCHGSVVSSGTGDAIREEWMLSGHNTENGASCSDCHEPATGHPNSCNSCHNGPDVPLRDEVVRNPDTALICLKCHDRGAASELPRSHFYGAAYDALPSSQTTWNNMSTVAYVTSQSTGNCSACHNPHNTAITQEHRDWAECAHGDLEGKAWIYYDFKTRGTSKTNAAETTASDCVRCHSTTGYINYVATGFRNISAFARFVDRGKEPLRCDGCHLDGSGRSYGWQVRAVPQVTAYYNYSVAAKAPKRLTRSVDAQVAQTFPYIGNSNVCIICHAGRTAGVTLKAIDGWLNDRNAAGALTLGNYSSYYNNLNFINSHYLTGAAILFKKGGYEYEGQNYANIAHFQHDLIGKNNTKDTGNSGPCVGCHLIPGRHTFKPYTHDNAGRVVSIDNQICQKCHAGAYGLTADKINAEVEEFEAAMAAFDAMLKLNGIYYGPSHPYYFKSAVYTSANAMKKWRKVETLGAAFNYNLIHHDPGAYAHNRIYVKRLIHDSIDWLYTGSTTPWALPQNKGAFGTSGNVEAAINGTSLDAATKEAAILYLLGGPGGTRP